MMVAYVIQLVLMSYFCIGLIYGVYFITSQVKRVDPAAQTSGWGFRLLILPGVAALWPILLFKREGDAQ